MDEPLVVGPGCSAPFRCDVAGGGPRRLASVGWPEFVEDLVALFWAPPSSPSAILPEWLWVLSAERSSAVDFAPTAISPVADHLAFLSWRFLVPSPLRVSSEVARNSGFRVGLFRSVPCFSVHFLLPAFVVATSAVPPCHYYRAFRQRAAICCQVPADLSQVRLEVGLPFS